MVSRKTMIWFSFACLWISRSPFYHGRHLYFTKVRVHRLIIQRGGLRDVSQIPQCILWTLVKCIMGFVKWAYCCCCYGCYCWGSTAWVPSYPIFKILWWVRFMLIACVFLTCLFKLQLMASKIWTCSHALCNWSDFEQMCHITTLIINFFIQWGVLKFGGNNDVSSLVLSPCRFNQVIYFGKTGI